MPYHLTAGENLFDRDWEMSSGGLILGFEPVATRCRVKWRFCCERSTNFIHQAFRKQACYSFVEFAGAQENGDDQRESDDSVYR
jgi:hypothetical protein